MEVLSRQQLSKVAEVKVSYRPKIRPSQRPVVKCAKDVYEILLGFWNCDMIELCEQFCVVLLNNRGSILGIVELSTGGFTGVVVDTKMVFCIALKACACSIVVAHNHPSGNLKPSSQDIKVTNRLVEAGKILEIPVQDHLIISNEGFVSLAEEGYIK